MQRLAFLCSASLLLSLGACKAQRSGSLKDLLVNSPNGQQRIYYAEDKLIKTALCPKDAEPMSESTSIETLRANCREGLSEGVSPAEFRERMIKLFQETYRTSQLSSYETLSLDQLISQIQDNLLSSVDEAEKGTAPLEQILNVWPQFMPFAAGVAPTPFPDTPRSPIVGSLAKEITVQVSGAGTEYEVQGLEFAKPVNLFTLMANRSDNKGSCPALSDVLSITAIKGDVPIPAFGGAVIGGSRFLLTAPVKRVSSLRFIIYSDGQDPDYEGLRECTVGVFATKVDPIELSYQVTIPNPVKLNARDQKMAELMAKPEVRSWHFLWHGVRNSWRRLSETQREEIRTKLGAEWDAVKGGTGDPKEKGEEFLHMHHVMLKALRKHLGTDMYEAWLEPPKPDDPQFPVPEYKDPAMKKFYEARYETLRGFHFQAIDPAFVAKMSLSEYGSWLEENLHNLMHMTWAHPTQWYPSYGPTMEEIISEPNKYPVFNHPSNNSLAGTYTSHVNPNFYRLHGYIDARIDTWLKAHGLQSISETCVANAQGCYQWKRTWAGLIPSMIGELSDHAHGIDPAKIAPLDEPTFREIARASQMIPGARSQ